jgi:hypothetical protein
MEAATEEMLRTSDTRDRIREMTRLADGLTEDNLPGALAAYERDLARIDPHEVRIIANAWARIDPRGAVDRIISTWRYPRASFQSVEEVVFVWARDGDAAEARAYVDPLVAEAEFGGGMPINKFLARAMLKALAANQEFQELTNLLSSFSDEPERQLWLTEVMVEMNRVAGGGVTREWVDSIPWDAGNGLKLAALQSAMDWTAKLSPAAATYWYEELEQAGNDPQLLEILEAVVRSWGVHETPAALEWLAERQQSLERDRLIRQLVFGWLTRLPDDAAAWIMARRDHMLFRDRALPLLVDHVLKGHRFEEAETLAHSIVSPTERNTALVVIYAEWSRYSEKEASAAMEAADVSEELRARVATRLGTKVKVQRRLKDETQGKGKGEEG